MSVREMSYYCFSCHFLGLRLLLSSFPLPTSDLIKDLPIVLPCVFLEKASLYDVQANLYLLGTHIHLHLPQDAEITGVNHHAHLIPLFKSLPLFLFVGGDGGVGVGAHAHVLTFEVMLRQEQACSPFCSPSYCTEAGALP